MYSCRYNKTLKTYRVNFGMLLVISNANSILSISMCNYWHNIHRPYMYTYAFESHGRSKYPNYGRDVIAALLQLSRNSILIR